MPEKNDLQEPNNTSLQLAKKACKTPVGGSKPFATPTITTGRVTPAALVPEAADQIPIKVWIAPSVPLALSNQVQNLIATTSSAGREGLFEVVAHSEEADFRFEPLEKPQPASVSWVYALVAPFPTLLDEVSFKDVMDAWRGQRLGIFGNRRLMVSESTKESLEARWGPPSQEGVEVVEAELLFERAWSECPSWAIVPFEALQPRWKVLRVDGMSPLQRDLKTGSYPLVVNYGWLTKDGTPGRLAASDLDQLSGNRDIDKMTILIMTGTTALVRGTALRMEEMGVNYPAQEIGALLRSADLTHISNEVPFYPDCPPAKPLRQEMRFCSSPRYLELFDTAGADIIELTGNHLNDWGPEAFRYTLDLFRQRGFAYYGGGYNQAEARKPLLVEDHGNRIAFLGCNPMGPPEDWAGVERPGAASCDLDWMEQTVRQLRDDGYLVVVTFQHFEVDDYKPQSSQRVDMQRMAAAGAVIVSGSQSHSPQTMMFVNDHLVHYGLGNLFFDQMTKYNRRAFIDRHVFYNNRYISTELLTIMIEDSARPRLMTAEERQKLLQAVFSVATW